MGGGGGGIFQNLSPPVTLEMDQGHQNLISSCPCLNNIAAQVGQNPSFHSGDSVQKSHFPTI